MRASTGSSAAASFPLAGTTSISGSKAVYRPPMRSWKPLNTDSVQSRAAVPKATPATEMPEMMLMAPTRFREKR